MGALLYGIGAATPAFADAAATNDPGRGEAVAQFIGVLVGRLGGAGKGMIVVGIVLALAPGHDGVDEWLVPFGVTAAQCASSYKFPRHGERCNLPSNGNFGRDTSEGRRKLCFDIAGGHP